jgi:hypothetical protein
VHELHEHDASVAHQTLPIDRGDNAAVRAFKELEPQITLKLSQRFRDRGLGDFDVMRNFADAAQIVKSHNELQLPWL